MGASLNFQAAVITQQIQALDNSIRSLNASLTAYNNTVTRANREADKSSKSMGKFREVAKNTARTLDNAFRNLAVYGGLLQMRSLLTENTTKFLEFAQAVAEVQTIAGTGSGLAGVFENVARQSSELSENLVLPRADVIEATYQTLSNQVATLGESQKFLATTGDFAVASVTSLGDSVNLVSGILKAYNADVEDAGKITDQLFKTIELGRTRGSELAPSFGRVAQLAAQLKIPVAEVDAALATLTVQGVQTRDAMTFLRAIFLKLIRPTESMREALNQMGFESGVTAVNTIGLRGVLQQLEKQAISSGNTFEVLGEQFSRVRAITGAAGLTGTGGQLFDFNLREIENATNAVADAKKIIEAAPGRDISREFQKIKNFLVDDIGGDGVAALNAIQKEFGELSEIFKSFTGIVKGLTAAFIASRTAAFAFGKASPVAAVASLAAAAVIYAIEQQKAWNAELEKTANAWSDVRRKLLQSGIDKLLEETFDTTLIDKFITKSTAGLEGFRVQNKKTINAQLELFDELSAGLKAAGDDLFAGQRDAVASTQRSLTQFRSNISTIETSITRLRDNLREAENDFQIESIELFGGSNVQLRQITALRNQAQAARQEFDQIFRQEVVDVRDIQQANNLLDTQVGISKKIQDISRQRLQDENAFGVNRRREAVRIKEEAELQIQLREQALQVFERQLKIEEEAAKKAEQRVKIQKDQLRNAIDAFRNLQRFDVSSAVGDAVSFEDLEKAEKQFDTLVDKFRKSRDSLEGITLGDAIATEQAIKTIEDSISAAKGLFDTRNAQLRVEDDLNKKIIEQRKLSQELAKEADKRVKIVKEISTLQDAIVTFQRKSTSELAKAQQLQSGLAKINESAFDIGPAAFTPIATDLGRIFKQLGAIEQISRRNAETGQIFSDEDLKRTRGALISIVGELDLLTRKSVEIPQALGGTVTRFVELSEQGKELRANAEALATILKDVGPVSVDTPGSTMFEQLQAIRKNEAELKERLGGVSADLVIFGGDLEVFSRDAAESFKKVTSSLNPLPETINRVNQAFREAITELQKITAEQRRTNNTIKQVRQPLFPSIGRMFGGPLYRQSGGIVGTDRIPALLSRGETVLNQQASRRFFSSIAGLNTGGSASSTTNETNIGPVTFNVSGAGSPEITAREIVQKISRLRRRGYG